MVKVVEQADRHVMDVGIEEIEVVCRKGSVLGMETISLVEHTTV
jgi:hypothetical protein